MQILYLSTGIFKIRYGQQTYEWNFLSSCIKEYPYNNFRIILLNDYEIPYSWEFKSPYIKFILCGSNIRLISKIKFVLISFWSTLIGRPKLIICGHINLSPIAWIISCIFKIEYIVLTYGEDAWGIKSKFKLIALSYAHSIISMSHYTAQKIKEQVPQYKNEIFVLPASIDTQLFRPDKRSDILSKRYNLDGYKVLMTLGRLDYADRDKGCDKVIISLPKVIEEIPKVKYLLVGEGDDIPRLLKLASNLGLQDNVIFTGFIQHNELCLYYNLCDVFVMPSKQEGFGIVFLEALACGKPVIAGNQDGSREALLDGRLGLLVDPEDIDEISEAIIKILKCEVDRRFLDENFLRQSVMENFGVERFNQKLSYFLDYINNAQKPYQTNIQS